MREDDGTLKLGVHKEAEVGLEEKQYQGCRLRCSCAKS